jgi:cobalt/nickel transport system ATP-binding protein
MSGPIVVLNQLSYRYPDGTQALGHVNLTLEGGERVALVGANGAGKSTLLQHLNGLLLPQSGEVRVGKWRVTQTHLKSIRNWVGLVFQNPDDQLFMPTVWEDVTFGPKNQGMQGTALTAIAQEALDAVGLNPQDYAPRYPQSLSGGEKKRVAIACVLAMQPQLLVLDEPTAQLDPRARRQLIQLLSRLPLTQVLATHDLDLALELCDRTVILSQGEIVADGPTAQLLSNDTLLERYGLEAPLSYRRPYCLRHDASCPEFSAKGTGSHLAQG